jgi:hypothetical protein
MLPNRHSYFGAVQNFIDNTFEVWSSTQERGRRLKAFVPPQNPPYINGNILEKVRLGPRTRSIEAYVSYGEDDNIFIIDNLYKKTYSGYKRRA